MISFWHVSQNKTCQCLFGQNMRKEIKWLILAVMMAFPAYSGVTRRPVVSARLCCHNAFRLPPPHTLLIFPYPLFAPQHPPLPLSRILPVTAPLKRATHLLSLISAWRPHLTQRSPPRWPCVDHSLTFRRLFSLSAAADVLHKALIIQWHSR